MTALEKAQAELASIRSQRAEVQAKLTGKPVASSDLVPAEVVNATSGSGFGTVAVLAGAGLILFVVGKRALAARKQNPRPRRRRRR